jgi:hypothetical protein
VAVLEADDAPHASYAPLALGHSLDRVAAGSSEPRTEHAPDKTLRHGSYEGVLVLVNAPFGPSGDRASKDLESRAVVHDLTGVTARRIAVGLLALDIGVPTMIVVVDRHLNGQQLLGIGVGILVFGALALAATIGLGDIARVMWLRFTGAGYNDLDRKRQAQHLARRCLVLLGVCTVLMVIGPPLVIAALGSQPPCGVASPPATPRASCRRSNSGNAD